MPCFIDEPYSENRFSFLNMLVDIELLNVMQYLSDIMSDLRTNLDLVHQMLIVDARVDSEQKLTAKAIIDPLIDELLVALQMEKLGPLEIFIAIDEKFPGWSFIQPITTSHISGHFFENGSRSHFHFDIYSCKKFDWYKVITIINNHIIFLEWAANFIKRETDIHDRSVISITGKENRILSEVTL